MADYLAEFAVTLLLLLFGGGVVASVVLNVLKGFGGGWIVIAAGWGPGVAMAVYAAGRGGGHISPDRDLGPRLAHALLPVAGKGGSDCSYAWFTRPRPGSGRHGGHPSLCLDRILNPGMNTNPEYHA